MGLGRRRGVRHGDRERPGRRPAAQAARDATRAAIAHLGERRGLDREEAYAVVRVACDLRIHEIVDVPNRVVGCFIPDAIFASR
jgi:acetamidase/formamidase